MKNRFWKICKAFFNPIWKCKPGWAERINTNSLNKWNRLQDHLKVSDRQYFFLKFNLSSLIQTNRMKINLCRRAEVDQMQAVVFLLTSTRFKIKELKDWVLLCQKETRVFKYLTKKRKQNNTRETTVSYPAIMALIGLLLITMTMISMVSLNLACRWINPIVV